MARRISDEPAFVLHRYDWSESSLIVEVFTREHGRVAVVAKGAKRPSSNFRPVLLPLQPLHVAFGGDAEIRTLKGAEWVGGQVMPTGDALMAGFYLNELLLRLLARDDPHPLLFEAYADVVAVLASEHGEDALEPALRGFELLLLREIGLLPALDLETGTQAALDLSLRYSLLPEGGLVRTGEADGRATLAGAEWLALQQALDQPAPFPATLRVAAGLPQLKPQLRAVLNYHCGTGTLRTRQLMIDLQTL
jgi:DNA repair protein RecO (recombination protein O)